MLSILLTLEVSINPKLTSFRDEHPYSRKLMSVTFEVSSFDKSSDFRKAQS